MKLALTPQPLTAAAFAPFGDIIAVDEREPIVINGGNTLRYDALARVALGLPGDFAAISLFRAMPRKLPMTISMLERHPLGSQAFHPLSGYPYLVLVALPGNHAGNYPDPDLCYLDPDPQTLQLFLASAAQGVNYARDTWHHPLLALSTTCDFLVVDRKGQGQNCIEFVFPAEWSVTIPSIPSQDLAYTSTCHE
jgi:ureidoglycolate lyase